VADAEGTRQREPGPFLVQVKYAPGVVSDAPEHGWLTAAASADRDMAVRRAAAVYRSLPAPCGSLPQQVRVRSEDDLRREGGDEAVQRAYQDVLMLAEGAHAVDFDSDLRGGVGGARPRSR
jgi:hypothetical protein